MKKYLSLIKAAMSEGMNIFKVSTKKKSKFSKIILPVVLALIIMSTMYSYADGINEMLEPGGLQFVVITLFILFTSIITLIEGIYKSGNLLFNCRDDNLLLSLPLKKSTILFIRMFKFYVFELLFNSLFLLPAIICYAIHVNPGATYYIISIIGLLVFPIIPILLSCIIGSFITAIASKFKGKNVVQTILTTLFLLAVFYISFNIDGFMNNIAEKATSLNDTITKIYYPAGTFIELILSFNILKLLEFIGVHLGLAIVTIIILGKIYFKINSNVKSVKIGKTSGRYKIKSTSQTGTLIKKELSRFVSSPVFITNAGFGLVLFLLGCIAVSFKFDEIINSIIVSMPELSLDYIKMCLPVIMLGFIGVSGFMTSITSSMISLEGKSFNILKSLPVRPYTIVKSKVLAAILIMIPFIILGDFIVFIRFSFDIISIILLLIASVLLPLISETIGILINLRYPRMDAKNDTEIVKQSMSSTISVFIGMALAGLNVFFIYLLLNANLSNYIIMLLFDLAYLVIYTLLKIIIYKTAERSFNNIKV